MNQSSLVSWCVLILLLPIRNCVLVKCSPILLLSSSCAVYLWHAQCHYCYLLPQGLGSVQPDGTGGQLKWSDPPNEFRRQLFTLVTEMNSQKDVVPQTAHAQNITDL